MLLDPLMDMKTSLYIPIVECIPNPHMAPLHTALNIHWRLWRWHGYTVLLFQVASHAGLLVLYLLFPHNV